MREQLRHFEGEQRFTLPRAIRLATTAHGGQIDKHDGRSFIQHPLRVMRALELYGTKVQIAAVLHDTVEKTAITFEELESLGLGEEIIDGIRSVTIEKDELYEHAIERARNHRIGRLIRLADSLDKANEKRLAELPPDEQAELRTKHVKAIAQLTEGDEWLRRQMPIIQTRIETLYDSEPRFT